MASGGTSDDRLSIWNQGWGAGQIGFDGTRVTYGGVTIGTAFISAGAAPLSVVLNGNVSTAAVQALVRAVTYQNVSTASITTPRYVRFKIVDGTGLASN